MGMSHLCNISFREPLFLNILLYLSFLKNNINLFEVEMKRRTTNLMNLTHLNALREKKKDRAVLLASVLIMDSGFALDSVLLVRVC